ncbi:hypothetical protein SLA2020_465910 [Shorea laevis]
MVSSGTRVLPSSMLTAEDMISLSTGDGVVHSRAICQSQLNFSALLDQSKLSWPSYGLILNPKNGVLE